MSCRICLESDGVLITPCGCKGSAAYVHEECISQWLHVTQRDDCEICHTPFVKSKKCSFQPEQYCNGCVSCTVPSEYVTMTRSTSMWILCTASLFMMFTPRNEYLMSNAVVSLALVVGALQNYCCYGIPMQNVLIRWKLSFTVPYLSACLLQFFYTMGECEEQCYLQEKTCGERCTVYPTYNGITTTLNDAVFMEFINLAIIVWLRSVILCFVYMRKVTLGRREDEEPRDFLSNDVGSGDTASEAERPLLSPSGEDEESFDAAV